MTTYAELFGSSTSWTTVNAGTFSSGACVSVDALNIAGLSPIPFDLAVTVEIVYPNSAPAGQKAVNVWAACSEDGTHYDDHDQYSGSNNQPTLESPTNWKGPFVIVVRQNVTIYGIIPSLRGIIGSRWLPRCVGLILDNETGNTITTTPTITYTPVNAGS